MKEISGNIKKRLGAVLCLLLIAASIVAAGLVSDQAAVFKQGEEKQDFIRWVDCNVSGTVLKEVYAQDVKYHGTEVDFHFIEALAYLTALNGNRFQAKTDLANLKKLTAELESGKKMAELSENLKYYTHYLTCYEAIFAEYVGTYTQDGVEGYGLKTYFPIAKGFDYSHYDDFGNSRSYGFKRVHLGHDMMGLVGTPIVAVEGGTITECGWNQYGGWRIGIRSHDQKRYYYYAHLRKDRPYAEGLAAGQTVEAGEVIGYMGRTGYSKKENVNMSGKTHLHFGLQLIFDESQEDGAGEIWVDLYAISKLLAQNRAETVRNAETKEYTSCHLKKAV